MLKWRSINWLCEYEYEANTRTIVITVAHRINTVLDSNRIVVLGDGRIVEEGSPAELMGRKGAFWELAVEAKVIDGNAA